jgi:sec-independent protein translocase protein TatB
VRAGRKSAAYVTWSLPVLFDLSFFKLLVLGVIALVVFGPERLPGMAVQAGRALRELRRMAEGARSELQENLGPEFSELSRLDLADLHPKRFVRKHLLDELTDDGGQVHGGTDMGNGTGADNLNGNAAAGSHPAVVLPLGEQPPYDAEAT